MAKIIVKFNYMKAGKSNVSGYVEYIAKREGVIKNLKLVGNNPETNKHKTLIEKLISDNPSIKDTEHYKAYLQDKTVSSATELITEIEEYILNKLSSTDAYIQYIAERPRVVKEDNHGLFSSTDKPIILETVKEEVKNHSGNIWTMIISLKREDAERLGYNNLNLWKNLLRSKQIELAKNLKIDFDNFVWYGAFHDEAHHPHVHVVMYAKDGNQGYLNKASMNNIRPLLAREIFKQDNLFIYKKQTKYRDELKLASKDSIKSHIEEIKSNYQDNQKINNLLIELSERLKVLPGKHSYGYLLKPLKKVVDNIVNEISNEPEVQKLFDLWYEQRQEILNTYSSQTEEIRHLADLNEFKSIKNDVIKLAKEIDLSTIRNEVKIDTTIYQPVDIKVREEEIYKEIILDPILKDKNESLKEIELKDDLSKLYLSTKLFYHVCNMFETSMINQAYSNKVDYKITLKTKKIKLALGQHYDDSQRY